jgi:hypothetical protein
MPDSNSPSWFDVPMKSELTALTRPRISSGVSSCTSEERTTTLTTSAQRSADHIHRPLLYSVSCYPLILFDDGGHNEPPQLSH